MRIVPNVLISNWNQRVEGLSLSVQEFYEALEERFKEYETDKIQIERVQFSECGFMSPLREYLQVRRHELIFHICLAPFGNGSYVSWWLGNRTPYFESFLSNIPVLRWLVKPITYYALDTATMFQSMVTDSVEQVLNASLESKGQKALVSEAFKPTIRDVIQRKP